MKKLKIKLEGEVSNLILAYGWSCGDADPGICLEIEEYIGSVHFSKRGGVLTKKQTQKMIKYLQKYVGQCKMRKDKKNE